eukprot:767346-Hanusia_phi.AAC.1
MGRLRAKEDYPRSAGRNKLADSAAAGKARGPERGGRVLCLVVVMPVSAALVRDLHADDLVSVVNFDEPVCAAASSGCDVGISGEGERSPDILCAGCKGTVCGESCKGGRRENEGVSKEEDDDGDGDMSDKEDGNSG